MNPVLTISALNAGNSFENNGLSPISGVENGLSNDIFDGKFSQLLSEFVSSDGKIKPLDLAALKDLGFTDSLDLQKLANLGLISDSSDLNQLSVLGLLVQTQDTQIENIELFGNPELKASLSSGLINDELAEQGLLSSKQSKTGLLKTDTIIGDTQQQSVTGKITELSQVLDDVKQSQIFKDMNKSGLDFTNELLAQSGRQESNATKLVDQLSGLDKSVNPLNQLNAQTLKSYSGLEQSAKVMNRIEVPVNQAGWGEAVGSRLMMMVNGKIQSANIQIKPAELGPIEIKVSINQDQATVHFVANNSTVRDAIEDAFPRLKEMFSQNGLSLADANVSEQSSQQSSNQNDQLLDDHNDLITSSNTDNKVDTEEHETNTRVIDIGLINQYV